MRSAMLFKAERDSRGKMQLQKLVAQVSVPVPHSPDVVIYQGRVYVLHYEGMEVYYREAVTYHYQKSAVMVDGVEIQGGENALLHDHGRGRKT